MIGTYAPHLPRLVTFLLRNLATGAAIGAGVAAIMIAADVRGFGTMLAASTNPLLCTLLFAYGFAASFATGYLGTALIFVGDEG